MSTSATCFKSEKLGRIVELDRNMFANKILSMLHKDENFVQSYELRNDCSHSKFICKSLPKIYRLEVFIYLHKSKKVFCGNKSPASRL